MPRADQELSPHAELPIKSSALVEAYRGRFALDFEYEEWAQPYRDWLHASYLEIVERAVTDDLETGHFDRGINLARECLDVDPTAEHVEVSLLRLYRGERCTRGRGRAVRALRQRRSANNSESSRLRSNSL